MNRQPDFINASGQKQQWCCHDPLNSAPIFMWFLTTFLTDGLDIGHL
jgi:hypothetical protein